MNNNRPRVKRNTVHIRRQRFVPRAFQGKTSEQMFEMMKSFSETHLTSIIHKYQTAVNGRIIVGDAENFGQAAAARLMQLRNQNAQALQKNAAKKPNSKAGG